MTFKQFKITTLSLLFTSVVFAQKFDKKFSEKFSTNKDVLVNINATNADIEVTTWNKNEVSVEAVIEVEGLDKKEAEKYLKNWKFEALGNKSKVQIKTGSNNYRSFGKNNFVYFNSSENNFPNVYRLNGNEDVIVIPEMPEIPEIPEIVIPEIDFDFEIPEMDFNFQNIWNDIEQGDFDENNKRTFSFISKGKNKTVVIKSKKDWDKFKKSDDFKELKKSLKVSLNRAKERHRKIDKKKIKEEIKKARIAVKKINKEKLEKSLAKAKKAIEKIKIKMTKSYKNGDDIFVFENDDTKKVKVTKKIIIKVPKDATFDLNTRHCKVKLPKTKVSGKVSYGTFKADVLNGGKLNVSFSPVTINSLNACTLFLNNVTDAHVASVANTTLNSNSSGLTVDTILKDVEISNKFGELTINKIAPNYNSLKILLNYCNAGINSLGINDKLNFDSSGNMKTSKNGDIKFNGDFIILSKDNKIEIDGKYSQLTLKKQ